MQLRPICATVMTVALSVGTAQAATMNLDFDGSGGPTQSGYLSFPATGGAQTESETFTDPFGTGDDVTVAYDNHSSHSSNNTNQGSSIFSPVNLLQDWAGPRHMSSFDLTLSNLPAGQYDFLGYHHNDGGAGTVTADVTVEGSSVGSFTTSNNSSSSASTFSFNFTAPSDGFTADITYTHQSGGDIFPHNGFDLEHTTVIPTPASAALLGLGGLALLRRRRA